MTAPIDSLRTIAKWPQRLRHHHADRAAAFVAHGLSTRSEVTDGEALYTITEAGRALVRLHDRCCRARAGTWMPGQPFNPEAEYCTVCGAPAGVPCQDVAR